MNYTAPLRAAVIDILDKRSMLRLDELVTHTGVSPSRAKAYLTILENDGVVTEHPDYHVYHAGQNYSAWLELTPRTRPTSAV